MKSIKIIKKQAIKAAGITFSSGKMDESTARKFVKSFKQLPLSEGVIFLNYFLQAIKREKAKKTLTIDSVVKISKSDLLAVKKDFGRNFEILEINQTLSPNLLGGAKIRLGDIVFDNSIKSRVNQIKEALTA